MKKFLAIAFALIFALSCAAPAFAADITCPEEGCSATFETEKDLNKHLTSECPVRFGNNKGDAGKDIMVCSTCGAAFYNEEQYNIHKTDIHPDEPTWGEAVEEFFLNLDYSDFKELLDKATEALTGIGFPGLVVKLIDLLEDAIEGIIGAI